MSREILFKGKCLHNGKWIEGGYSQKHETTYCLGTDAPNPLHYYIACDEMTDWNLPNKIMLYEVDPSTVCQYTGLKDRNGVKIFEGDIMQAHSNPEELYEVCFGEFKVYDIESIEAIDKTTGWYLKVIPTDIISQTEPFNIDLPLNNDWVNNLQAAVSGTVFDNPELLEGGTGEDD